MAQRITASDPQQGAQFGRNVAIEGDVAVVGEYARNLPGAENAGAVHVFKWNGAGWEEAAVLTAPNPEPQMQLGLSVDISGDRIIAGAFSEDAGDLANAGAVYVFYRGEDW